MFRVRNLRQFGFVLHTELFRRDAGGIPKALRKIAVTAKPDVKGNLFDRQFACDEHVFGKCKAIAIGELQGCKPRMLFKCSQQVIRTDKGHRRQLLQR